MAVVNVLTSERRSRADAGSAGDRRACYYLCFLILADASAALAAGILAHLWHGGGSDAGGLSSAATRLAVLLMPPAWVTALWLRRAYEARYESMGHENRRRILRAAGILAVPLAVAAFLVDSTALFRQALVAIPLVALLTPVSRHIAGLRVCGEHEGQHGWRRALLVGHPSPVADFLRVVRRGGDQDPAGLTIVGACVPGPVEPAEEDTFPLPILGALGAVPEAARAAKCDVVVILACPELDTPTLRTLTWRLRDERVDLAFAPLPSAVSSERIVLGEFGGLPLMHIRAPIRSRPLQAVKGAFDRLVAALILLALAPVLLTLAALVRATSPGPAFFRQVRVGIGGREFTCLKFRTMVADAERMQAQLAHLNEKRDGVLFKISNDPRVTRIGAVLRKYSLDELPQLINVLTGSMSLVGPRPPLPGEVARYSEEMRGRLAVKPGLTGLWQVSGRSTLSWPESVRLDLSYVENWSPRLDAEILGRTATAVVRGTGV
ncbi:MAG TPA: sugar transferase [Actinocrinis sp.]|nr:sugar transferase [Actinocrinis sp.]